MEYAWKWAPTALGRILTGSPHWELRLSQDRLELRINGRIALLPLDGEVPVQASPGLLWGRLAHPQGELGGLPNESIKHLNHQATRFVEAQKERLRAQREQQLREKAPLFASAWKLINRWLWTVKRELDQSKAACRWFTHEQQRELLSCRPLLPVAEGDLDELLYNNELLALAELDAPKVEPLLKFWRQDWDKFWEERNEAHSQRELVANDDLLKNVERTPLSACPRSRCRSLL